MISFWPFNGFGFIIPFIFLFIGIRILRRIIGESNRKRPSFDEYERPPLPFDDHTEETHYQAADGAIEKARESVIFRLADELGGRLTVSDVVIGTDLGLKEAERMIDSMVDGVHVTMEVTESGRMVYEFPEIIARHEGKDDSAPEG